MRILVLSFLLFCGCAYNTAKLYDPTTGKLVGKSRTITFFDSKSSLAKLHIDTMAVTNHHGSFSPGISISGLNQESSSTNLNTLIGTVAEGVASGVTKGLK